jgi:bacillithiol system protein YtxJ
MSETRVHELESWRAAVHTHQRILLFKHSPICPTSATAYAAWSAFRAAHPDAETLFVNVIADRDVSRGLASECGVAHQSPQAILFQDGSATWDASHWNITAEALAGAWLSAEPSPSS